MGKKTNLSVRIENRWGKGSETDTRKEGVFQRHGLLPTEKREGPRDARKKRWVGDLNSRTSLKMEKAGFEEEQKKNTKYWGEEQLVHTLSTAVHERPPVVRTTLDPQFIWEKS